MSPWHHVGIEDDHLNRAEIENGALRIKGTVDGTVGSFTAPQPNIIDGYAYTIHDVPGVVAARNFVSLFNPTGSGVFAQIRTVIVNSYPIGLSETYNSMLVQRVSAASGGTLVPATDILHQYTSSTPTSMEVRHSGPTVTLTGLPVLAFPPPIASAVPGSGTRAGSFVSAVGLGPVLQPGEGGVFYTLAGNTNQRWSITVTWAEFTESPI